MQLAAQGQVYLIDTITLRNLEPLAPALENPAILKVLHGADYDVICLKRDFGIGICNLFDTMIAAQLLGHEHVGLAAQLELHFDLLLDKTLTRHDWGSRPIRPEHRRYLVEDVAHLERLAQGLGQRLAEEELLEEASIEFERVAAQEPKDARMSPDPEGFRRIKGAQVLDHEGLSILRELYFLREELAAKVDRPPFRVLGNLQLLEVAARKPQSLDSLRRIPGFTVRVIRAWGVPVLEGVKRGIENRQSLAFRPLRRERPPEEQVAADDALRAWRREKVEEEARPSLAILPNHVLVRLAARRPITADELSMIEGLGTGRLRRYGDEILDVLRNIQARSNRRR